MRLSEQQAEAFRRRTKNLLSEADLDERDLAQETAPWLSSATVYRLLNAGQSVTGEHIEIILHAVRNLVGIDADDLEIERNGDRVDAPPNWQTESCCARIDGKDQKVITEALATATARSHTMWQFGKVLPTILLEEEVADKVAVYQARNFARDANRALAFLREDTAVAREDFMNFDGYRGVGKINVVTPLSGLIRMARRLPPFCDIEPDHIDASFASLIADAVLEPERNLSLHVLNDMEPGPAREWVWKHDAFGTIAWFSSGIATRCRHRRCSYRILNASDSPAAHSLFDVIRSEFAAAENLACHGRDRHEVAEFLNRVVETSRRNEWAGSHARKTGKIELARITLPKFAS